MRWRWRAGRCPDGGLTSPAMRRSVITRRMRRTFRTVAAGAVCSAALAALTAAPAQAQAHEQGQRAAAHWELKDTGAADVRFRGLAAVSRNTAWVAGTKGTVLRTTDGGAGWR